jgi:hypothetical protein
MTRFVLSQPKARRRLRSETGAKNWELDQRKSKPMGQADTKRRNRCSK